MSKKTIKRKKGKKMKGWAIASKDGERLLEVNTTRFVIAEKHKEYKQRYLRVCYEKQWKIIPVVITYKLSNK